jgi:hypothetical protein
VKSRDDFPSEADYRRYLSDCRVAGVKYEISRLLIDTEATPAELAVALTELAADWTAKATKRSRAR